MQFQINTDKSIKGSEELAKKTEAQVRSYIERFESRITRIEIHLSDENSPQKGGEAMRCLLEARMSNHQPVVASHQAATVDLAVEGAAQKLERAITNVVGRLSDR